LISNSISLLFVYLISISNKPLSDLLRRSQAVFLLEVMGHIGNVPLQESSGLGRDIVNVVNYFQKKYGMGSTEEIWKRLVQDRDEINKKKAD